MHSERLLFYNIYQKIFLIFFQIIFFWNKGFHIDIDLSELKEIIIFCVIQKGLQLCA